MKQHKISPWLKDAAKPCDPEIFRRAVTAWEEPGRDAELGSRAHNTVRFLRSQGVERAQAYLGRIMFMDQIFEAAQEGGPLAAFVKPSEENECIMVSDVLLDAVATAPMKIELQLGPVFDIEEIRRRAQEAFEAEAEGT